MLLSVAALIIPVYKYLGGMLTKSYFLENFQIIDGGIHISVPEDTAPFVFGIIFLLMAGMVYEGSRLKEDSELTI